MSTLDRTPDGTEGIDVNIEASNPTVNYGTATYFDIGESNTGAYNHRSLIKFSCLSDGTIPASATINACSLFLTPITDESSNARTFRVYRMLHSWTEAGATWNKYDGTNNWPGGAGAFGAVDCEQTDIGSRAMTATETLNVAKEFVLTASKIQEIVAGTVTNNGFLLKADTETDDCYIFASSDHATAGYRPRILVTYTLSGVVLMWSST